MKDTWRLILKIMGLSLAIAGALCLLLGYWDKLMAQADACRSSLASKRGCSEFDDYDDDLLYED